jgi:4-hydroxy-3-polyprenylbenzoate decarboxylase
MQKSKIIVGVTGASGTIYGWRLLEKLRQQGGVEVHLILSRAGERTAYLEMGKKAADFRALADVWHPVEDIGSRIASGSFVTAGMVVAPCSIHTMSALAYGLTDNLITRAADVVLKERRKLVLMIREMPFHLGHLRAMTALAEMGAIVAPPVPAFYHKPETIQALVDHSVERVMDLLQLPAPGAHRWDGGRPHREGDE